MKTFNYNEASTNSLRAFQKQYPAVTSGDLQTFILGYQACFNDLKAHEESFITPDTRIIWRTTGGKAVLLTDMTARHIINALARLNKITDKDMLYIGRSIKEWMAIFNARLEELLDKTNRKSTVQALDQEIIDEMNQKEQENSGYIDDDYEMGSWKQLPSELP